MGKKTHHHSVHWSDEVEALVRANMRQARVKTLNAYIELLVRGHDQFLRRCKTAAEMAEKWRALMRILKRGE